MPSHPKKFIVITTINPKSKAIEAFESMVGWHVIVVGDKKSAPLESSGNLTFLSVGQQHSLAYALAELAPYNHYARKNIGYLYAIENGATIIYDTDDDNLPYTRWRAPGFECREVLRSRNRYFNIYRYFTDHLAWPRGFPLDEIHKDAQYFVESDEPPLEIGVWQGLADGDPDVDAIYRLTVGGTLQFEDKQPVALPYNVYCPFNSQNTFWHSSCFPYLYLPATTSFRFTDILRGYVAQYLMWHRGVHLGFTPATVYQERNVHNLMQDFADEVPCYLNVTKIVDLFSRVPLSTNPLKDLLGIYQLLAEQGHVCPEEVELLQAWISDFNTVIARGGPQGCAS